MGGLEYLKRPGGGKGRRITHLALNLFGRWILDFEKGWNTLEKRSNPLPNSQISRPRSSESSEASIGLARGLSEPWRVNHNKLKTRRISFQPVSKLPSFYLNFMLISLSYSNIYFQWAWSETFTKSLRSDTHPRGLKRASLPRPGPGRSFEAIISGAPWFESFCTVCLRKFQNLPVLCFHSFLNFKLFAWLCDLLS